MANYGLTIPALRGTQGDRTFYLALVQNRILNNFFTTNMEPAAERSQRTLDPKHAKEIGEYIVANPDAYLLGAIAYAIDVEGAFVSKGGEDMGELTIPLEANMRSLDGQHRRQGLKQAIDQDITIADDYTAVLIYVEGDNLKRRQMFSDMNATPKVVAKALNVSFDTRDPFARAAKHLAETHPLLVGRIEMQASRVKASSEDLFSLAGVYDALKRLLVGPTGRVRTPGVFKEEAIVEIGEAFFTALQDARPEFEEAVGDHERLVELRTESILFSTTTLRVIAGAFYNAMDEAGVDALSEFVEPLSKIDFAPDAELFQDCGFVSPGKSTPNARNQEVQAATDALAAALLTL